MRVDDVVGAVAVHGVSGFLGIIWVGVFAAGYPTGVNNVDSSIGGQLLGVATFLPLGFLSGYVASWILRKLNLLRVPVPVEIAGLDVVAYSPDIFAPEFGHMRRTCSSSPTERALVDEVQAADLLAIRNGGAPDDRVPV